MFPTSMLRVWHLAKDLTNGLYQGLRGAMIMFSMLIGHKYQSGCYVPGGERLIGKILQSKSEPLLLRQPP